MSKILSTSYIYQHYNNESDWTWPGWAAGDAHTYIHINDVRKAIKEDQEWRKSVYLNPLKYRIIKKEEVVVEEISPNLS